MKNICTLIIFSFLSINITYAQGIPCTDGTQASCKCSTAEVLCNTDQLDSFKISLSNFQHPGDGPSPLCMGQGVPNNPVWFGFKAWCTNLEVLVKSKNVVSAGGQFGLQFSIFKDCSMNGPLVCEGICQASDLNISVNNLIPGNTYYCLIDGCNGSTADLEFEVVNPCNEPFIGEWKDTLKGVTSVCNKAPELYSYSIIKPKNGEGLNWYIDSVLVYTGDVLKINWESYSPGLHELCVDVFTNLCIPENSLPLPKCIMVNVIEGSLNTNLELNHPICTGDSLKIIVSGGEFYSWKATNGFISNDSIIEIKDLKPYHSSAYVVNISNSTGCIVSYTIDVLIKDKPKYTIFPHDFTCADSCNGFINISGSNNYTYQWSNLQTGDYATFLCPGLHYVTISNGNCSIIDSALVNGFFSFDLSVSYSDTNMTANVSGGLPPFKYLWSTGETDSTKIKTNGLFCVTVTDSNDCEETFCDYILRSNQHEINSRLFELYPNPTSGTIYLKCQPSIRPKIKQCLILNEKGNELMSYNYLKEEINLKHLSAGVYFIVVKCEEGRFVKKFLKL